MYVHVLFAMISLLVSENHIVDVFPNSFLDMSPNLVTEILNIHLGHVCPRLVGKWQISPSLQYILYVQIMRFLGFFITRNVSKRGNLFTHPPTPCWNIACPYEFISLESNKNSGSIRRINRWCGRVQFYFVNEISFNRKKVFCARVCVCVCEVGVWDK